MAEADLEQLQRDLVEELRRKQVLSNAGAAMAFSAVPRHLFLPDVHPRDVYRDQAITLKSGADGGTISSASQPTIMAVMLEQLDLSAGLNVLEIGAATGFNAALIKNSVGSGGSVTTLEIDNELCERARDNLQAAGYSDVKVVNCDAARGYESRAPYDRIIATAGVWDVPTAWLRQLREEGKLVLPIWLDGVQLSAAFTKQPDGAWISCDNRPCAFVYLQGLAAGPQIRKRIGSSSLEILADDVDKIDAAALHLLLSDDQEIYHLDGNLAPEDFWFGFQLYLMLHEPPRYVFAVYAIPDGETYYGMEGDGVLLFTPGSAAFAPYAGGGSVHCFGGSPAFMKMQSLLENWRSHNTTLLDRIRLKLIPKALGRPSDGAGKLFTRDDHTLQVWLD
ncbi:MAG: methyltransferase domain-containing protein [Chloroflexi bacterium]|nr:methyltransferase domain-containing protein [Chloroflexota bacterium]